MTELVTWHNDQGLKDKVVSGYEAHMKADTLIKGEYFLHDEGFRGCHIGCVIHDLGGSEVGSHTEEYQRVTGLPKWLASLNEYFFENMDHPKNQEVTRDILQATPVGKDLTPAYHKFMVWLLLDEKEGTIRFCDEDGVKVTRDVAELHQRSIDGDNPSEGEWAAAGAAAGDVAWAAAGAAAGDAAGAVTWAAAGDAAGDAQAAKLIELLRQA